MPSFPPSVRPVLAALLTALVVASSVLVSGSATLLPAAHAAPAAPPETSAESAVSMDLVSLTPTSLAPGGTLEAQVEVTNTSSEPLSSLSLDLRTRSARVTDRGVLAEWQSDTSPDTSGAVLASSPAHPQLAPGESTMLSVQIAAEELNYSAEPYFWGTRRISLTVTSEEQPLGTLRTFVVWRPADATDTITQSVLLPLAAEDASAPVVDPEAFARSSESGRLASVRDLAPREDVDWWIDPALLDPPQLPVDDGADEETPLGPVREYAPDPRSAELAALLQESVGERTVLALPYAQADPVSLHQAGADRLAGVAHDHGDQVWQESGIVPRAAALPVDGSVADPAQLDAVLAAGGTAVVVPASSLRESLSSTVTPSSVGTYESASTPGSQLQLLAPDPALSAEFSLLTEGSDAEQTQQRLLAETATIASEYASAPRHLLISPSADSVLDPAAAGAALDALAEAPWIEPGRTGDLLAAADQQEWTTDPRSEGEQLYALGRIAPEEVHPSGPTGSGHWGTLEEAAEPELLDPAALLELDTAWEQVDTLAAAMDDDSPLDAPRLEILAGTSMRWRGESEIPAARAEHASARAAQLRDRIEVVPASGYNVISDAATVPITISNTLDTPITVRIEVTSDSRLVKIGETKVVEVPARGQIDAAVNVEAIANGTVTLTTVLTTEDGRPLTVPVDVPLTVNPSWENRTTLLLVIAMGLLVVVGVARARRIGSSTRAPAIRGPEDPVELSRSGRSTLDPRAAEEPRSSEAGAGGDPAARPDPDCPDPDSTAPAPSEEDPR
ncbi:DUF6049 family protein [Brachybacterium paraconglomeratum]|uniref:DUF6049 family protein n=1 Tax=Brachybacterium paraconglomeratum TaxID=173362 RepID=UPI0031E93F98